MALANRSLHDRPNADFSWDSRYPNGDKPSVQPSALGVDLVAFQAAGIDLTGRPLGTAVSLNYRQYLTGTSASTATLSVLATAGQLGNWTTSANNLTNPATTLATGTLQVRANDGIGNVVTFPAQNWGFVTAAQLKWTPGWCMELDRGSGGGGLSGWLTQIAEIASEPNITSVCYRDYWSVFEDAAGGTYTNGFNVVDQLVTACANAGKKFFLAFFVQSYNGAVTPANANGVLPTYFETLICSDGQAPGYVKYTGGTPWSGALNLQSMIWDSVVMGKFLSLHQAYAARYEGNPTFAMIHGPNETAIGVPNGTRGRSAATLTAQFQRWAVSARGYWPTTMLRCETNFLGANSDLQPLIDVCNTQKVVVGGPDIRTTSTVQSNTIFNGTTGTKDYRGINGFCSEIQGNTSYSPYTPTTAMPTLFNFSESGSPAKGGSMAAGIYMIKRNTWTGPNGNFPLWNSNILPFIRANPVPHIAYPSGW